MNPKRDLIDEGIASKSCIICGKSLTRRQYPCGKLETFPRFKKRQTCSHDCKKKYLIDINKNLMISVVG